MSTTTRRHPVRLARCALFVCALLGFAPATAHALQGMSVTPMYPSNVIVGQSGLQAELEIANLNTGADGALTICNAGDALPCPAGGDGITILPSCGAATAAVCTIEDSDILVPNRNGVGLADTACAGVPFIITPLAGSPSRRFRVAPPIGTNVVLALGASCRLALTFDVLRVPTVDADSGVGNGLQTLALGSAAGSTEVPGNSVLARGADVVTVAPGPAPAVPPPTPLMTDSGPRSPSNDPNPDIIGSAARFSTVTLHTLAGCAGSPVGQAVTDGGTGDFRVHVTVSVPANQTTTFYAKTTDDMSLGGLTSACSPVTLTYVHDSIAPLAPTVTGVDPAPAANDNDPQIKGSAAAATTVQIFANSACSGTPLASGTPAQFASPGIAVHVLDNTTTAFYAATFDGVNRACSTSFVVYSEDSSPPVQPLLIDTDPDSPADDNAPYIKGTAEIGSTVRLYGDAGCASGVQKLGTAAAFASPGLQVSVADNTTTQFYATAEDAVGNTSACSTSSIAYVEGTATPPPAPPPAPGSVSVTPAFPSGVVAGQKGLRAELEITNAASGAYGALTICNAGDALPCPAGGDGITILPSCGATVSALCTAEDPDVLYANHYAVGLPGTACAGVPFTLTPLAGSPSRRFRVAPPAGTNVVIALGARCRIAFTFDALKVPTIDADSGAGNGLQTLALGSATARTEVPGTTITGRAADIVTVAAGPPPGGPPAAPLLTDSDPRSPANDTTVQIIGVAVPSSTVRLYAAAGCGGASVGQAVADLGTGDVAVPVTVEDNSTTTFYAKTTDVPSLGGLTSACSPITLTYVEDSSPPPSPTFAATDPASPASDNAPRIKGTAEAGSTVRLYADAACAGGVLAIGTAAAFASPGLAVSVADNTTTRLHATAEDAAGNRSACSTSSIAYVESATGSSPPPPPPPPPPVVVPRPPTPVVPPPPPPGTTGALGTGPGCPVRGTLNVGTARNDTRTGSSGIDIMLGRAGNDVLRGLAGNDCLHGDAGNDRLIGGAGADRLFGDAGADRLDGGAGNDRLSGGAGNDRLSGTAGNDRLTDTSGTDVFSGGAGNDIVDSRDRSLAARRIADTVRCGGGARDVALADRGDRVFSDCERVVRR